MSSAATPITPSAFAAAIQDLPIGNLHSKAAELRNSILHLHRSNEQLQPFADDGDPECADALRENAEVIRKMEERIGLLRQEVEKRGLRWSEAEVEDNEETLSVGHDAGHVDMADGVNGRDARDGAGSRHVTSGEPRGERRGGSLSDEELQRRLREHMEAEENGVHL